MTDFWGDYMSNIGSLFIGAVLAVGTGYLTTYIDHLNKKDKFIFDISHEIELFSEFASKIQGIIVENLANADKIWLDKAIPTILTQLNNSRVFSNKYNDMFLDLKSKSVIEKLEGFCWQTNEIFNRLIYGIKQRSEHLTMKAGLENKLSIEGVNNPIDSLRRHIEVTSYEAGLINLLEIKLIEDVNKLLEYQTQAMSIKKALQNEYTWYKRLSKFINN